MGSNKCDSGPELQDNPLYYKTFPSKDLHEKFFHDVFDLILKEAIFEGVQRDKPVVRFKLPENLEKILHLKLGKTPVKTQEDLLDLLKEVMRYSVKTGHPYFINQLFSGLDPYGICAEWVASALNSSVYTYEVAPVFTLMELEVFERMRDMVGFPRGQGDGLFCPGGSMANGYAISVARYRKRPEVKERGLCGMKEMVMFVSEDCHYSFKKLASFQGLGMKNVVGIKVDRKGKMIIEDLVDQIEISLEKGQDPFMVAATAGTTVLGAFDPIEEVAKICQKYELYLHVDAAWGGGALMSPKYRHLLKGIEKADSVTWNPHKLLCAPQQCSTFLIKDSDVCTQTHATKATYLFQQDKFYDAAYYDTGDKHVQCGRRADVLKFWFMWKAKGSEGFEAHINHIFGVAEYCVQELKSRSPAFQLLMEEPECTNITFWYIPPSLRDMNQKSDEFWEKLHKVAPKIKEAMMRRGSMMITYQPLRHYQNFFRLVIQSSEVTKEDIKYFLDEIESCGKDIEV
ncbi:unnamed protein product [Orchesella dallaii]|uniref:Cysteine sulfinic acid decarboxylase n=1 Tax=Orchesella dallaii TaxID=48710 RepID=A0ABP1PX61_9HEXA